MTFKEFLNVCNTTLFWTQGQLFIEKKWPEFKNTLERKDFLTNFLVFECINAVPDCSNEEFHFIYEKVQKLVESEEIIFSENLPVHRKKGHANKRLQNVYYKQEGTLCTYEEKSDA